ncbi:MAG: hypothetical protein HY814_06585 [Candidatus Riflebacteria bacterium]|nr:hypothetical protein [Candidatus Riflebacteria bacterium]
MKRTSKRLTAVRAQEPAPETPEPPRPQDPRVGALESKYRDFFKELGQEGEAVEADSLETVVTRSLEREGCRPGGTGVSEVLDLLREMIDSREEGDGIVVRFRVGGKDVESFKIGR